MIKLIEGKLSKNPVANVLLHEAVVSLNYHTSCIFNSMQEDESMSSDYHFNRLEAAMEQWKLGKELDKKV